jgi:hypothetical protein
MENGMEKPGLVESPHRDFFTWWLDTVEGMSLIFAGGAQPKPPQENVPARRFEDGGPCQGIRLQC